jgi:7-carboxy-7-deazaguanine synthase
MLTVNEIFSSIEGETSVAGWPATFIRLAGCNLRCVWCDTKYAWEEGSEISIHDIVEEAKGLGMRRVVVTGGEPLIQGETFDLIKTLADEGFDVFVETNGSKDIDPIDKRAKVRLDLKSPSSGSTDYILWDNIGKLKIGDEIKIVIAGPEDYSWAKDIIRDNNLLSICPVNLTPEVGHIQPHLLAKWIVDDRLDIRLNLQLHKVIWHPEARGV